MRFSKLILAGLLLAAAAPSFATSVVRIDTTSLGVVNGFLDFNLAPGTDPMTVTISGFSPAANLNPAVDPSSTGAFAGNLTSGNSLVLGSGFADYFRGFTFGGIIQFFVTFSGPAITSPTPGATVGNTFAFSLFDASGSSPLLTSNDTFGYLFTMDVAPKTGAVSVTPFALPSNALSITDTPEPATVLIIGAGLAAIGLLRKKKA